MKILLANDDGVGTPGIGALYEELALDHQVVVVAPDSEKSGVGHGISLRGPLLARPLAGFPYPGFAVKGTPADCVKLALGGLLDFKPDLVISGINRGSNLGAHVLYSGTTAAAREAAMRRIPALAFSLLINYAPGNSAAEPDFKPGAAFARKLVAALPDLACSSGIFLNVNFPPLSASDIKGVRYTHQATGIMGDGYELQGEEDQHLCYWPKWSLDTQEPPTKGSDLEAVRAGYISITPMRFEQTHTGELERLAAMNVHW